MTGKFLVMIGPPGAGKGTQAKRLQQALGLPHVSTGVIFRQNLQAQTDLGRLAQSYMDDGELVPDDVTVAMVRDRLAEPDCAAGAILDGFPRTPAQAAALDDMLAEQGHELALVPYIQVPREELVARLLKRAQKEGRTDDNEETIRNRMRVYEEQTAPLLEYFRRRNLLVPVNGDQSIDAVFAELLAIVNAAL
jgi:adenylate kinase